MRAVLGLVFLCLFAFSEDFITPFEYGKMLYQNPRGIGCDKCHGIKGEGTLIATYKSGTKTKYLFAPAINKTSKEKFIHAINNAKSVMPSYFLTNDEIASLYYYLQKVNSKKDKNESTKK